MFFYGVRFCVTFIHEEFSQDAGIIPDESQIMSTTAETVHAQEPPHIRELPLIGSLPSMASDPTAFFVKNYHKYGPVYSMSILGRKYKVLCGATAAKFMSSRAGRGALRSREFWEGLAREYGATNSLPGSDGEEHDELRNVLRHGYSREAIKGRYNELIDITDRVIERDWPTGGQPPVLQSFQFMNAEQLGIMITGKVPKGYTTDIRVTILYILNCLVTRQRPKFLMLSPKYRKARQRVFELGDQIREDYENGNLDNADRRTLVDDIMEANRDKPHVMPDRNLRLQLTAPYVAGLDTVANTLSAAVYCILKHEDVHQRILQEVDEFFAGEEPVEEQGLLNQLPNLNGAIKETMRLYPINVAMIRTANKDFEFEGCSIKEGEMVYMSTAVAHFLEDFYPNPEKFDIDRYTRERREDKQSGAYTPWGAGPHTCLGRTLAEIQLILSLARIFYKLDLSLPSPDYVLKTKTAPTPGPSTSFKVRVNGYREHS